MEKSVLTRVGRLLLSALLLLCAPGLLAAQAADRLAGTWDGAIEIPGAHLTVQVVFTTEGGQHRVSARS
jgi:hypothetical protein